MIGRCLLLLFNWVEAGLAPCGHAPPTPLRISGTARSSVGKSNPLQNVFIHSRCVPLYFTAGGSRDTRFSRALESDIRTGDQT